VDDEVAERLQDRRLEAHVRQPLGRRGAGRGLALADLVAVDDDHPRPAAPELARDREAREGRPADHHVVVAAERGTLGSSLRRANGH
jgi:hypothetical protein